MTFSGTYRQPDPRFEGPAYEYLRPTDALPADEQIGSIGAGGSLRDPMLRVRLDLHANAPAFYLVSATLASEGTAPLVLGCYVAGRGRYYDVWEHVSIAKFAARRPAGRPPRRDLTFEPARLSDVRRTLAAVPAHLAAAGA